MCATFPLTSYFQPCFQFKMKIMMCKSLRRVCLSSSFLAWECQHPKYSRRFFLALNFCPALPLALFEWFLEGSYRFRDCLKQESDDSFHPGYSDSSLYQIEMNIFREERLYHYIVLSIRSVQGTSKKKRGQVE